MVLKYPYVQNEYEYRERILFSSPTSSYCL